MKLISLNIWGGKAFEPLMEFIKNFADDVDVFCFQEVFHSNSGIVESHGTRMNVLDDLAKALPDFLWYFSPEQDRFDLDGPINFDASLGQAAFVRKTIEVESEGGVFVYRERNSGLDLTNIPASLQYLRFAVNNKRFTVCNFHGLAFPGHKLDTPERIEQSRRIRNFLDQEQNPKILCGDFNLMPNTESMRLLEKGGLVNLIETFKIPCTRSRISPFFGRPDFQKFADYVLVSPDINVIDFRVPDVAISDHLPLILEFS